MNSNNPFTVPDGFFEKETSTAVSRACAIRRRRIAAAVCAAALALAFPVTMHLTRALPSDSDQLAAVDYTLQDDVLAANYSNDIFLQVTF